MSERKFEQMKLFGELVLFTPDRIRTADLPKGIYKYEVRHDDEGKGIITEIARGILVNHWGTVLSKKYIDLGVENRIYINEDKDIEYLNQPSIPISEYLQKNKTKNRDKER